VKTASLSSLLSQSVSEALRARRSLRSPGLRSRSLRARFSRGVTLIEILIVLAIVGLVAGGVAVVAIPKFKQAQIDNTKIEVKKIHPIADAFRAAHANECPTIDTLKKSRELTGNTADAWGKPYRITCEGEELRVASNGPDGVEGNADDIAEPPIEK
jgi:general secretion pathway protein G